MPKVSSEHKAEVRQRLLDAAHVCLEEKGLEGMTTREVLERAGMSAGTLYHYFTGKDDLVMALAERIAATDFPHLSDDVDLLAVVARLLGPHETSSLMPELRLRARFDADVRNALSHYDEITIGRFVPVVEQAMYDGLIDTATDAAAMVELVELVYEAVQAHAAARMWVTSHERVVNAFLSALSTLAKEGVTT
jgi:AcrR family transcriptional regulator